MKVAASVHNQIQATADAKTQEDNFNSVSAALTEKFGNKADEAVNKAAADAGMTFESMVELAKSNPKAALKLCDVTVKTAVQPNLGSTNTQGFNMPLEEKKADSSIVYASESSLITQYLDRLNKVVKQQ